MHLQLVILGSCLALALATKYEKISPFGNYRYSPELKTWHGAKKTCEAEGATLAVLNSHEEAMALKNLLRSHRQMGNSITHIGFNDEDEEGMFMTVRGGTLSESGYTIWKYPPTKSATNNINDCGAMRTCGRLTDVPCAELHGFICEKL